MARNRGRPLIDDSQALSSVADRLLNGEAKSIRSAIVQTVGNSDSAIRRLQRKWRDEGHNFLAEARERRKAQGSDARGIGFLYPAGGSTIKIAMQAQRLNAGLRAAFNRTDDLRRILETRDKGVRALAQALKKQDKVTSALQQVCRLEHTLQQLIDPLAKIRQMQASLDPFRRLQGK